MIIPSNVLEKINENMLGRGAPVKRDDFGYNVPDYNKLSSIWMGANERDLYEIASRLIKYYDTQLKGLDLGFTKNDLIETAKHYEVRVNSKINKPSVTVGFNDDYTTAYIGFKYNNEFIFVCRDFKYKFDRNLKSWYGDSRMVLPLLQAMQEIGADTEKAIEIVMKLKDEGKISFKGLDLDNKEEIFKEKIKVIEIDEEKVGLKFEYNLDIIQEIKALKYREFNWDNKTWEILKFDIPELYNNIKYLDIELSDLEKYLDNIPTPKLKVVKAEGYDVEIDFPFMKQIINSIKTLDYYKYNSNNKTWTIDVREIDILNEKIKDIIDTSELENVQRLEEKPIVELRDYSYLKRKPYAHQYTAAKFLLEGRRRILADEMGGGKTLSSIMAAYSLPGPRLVVCPASLKLNWAKEIEMVDLDGKIHIIRDKGIDEKADWNIINYDILEKHFEKLNSVDWEVIIFDEAHYMKAVTNGGKPDSKRADYGLKLGSKSPYVFSLTGTPITNRPKDIFNLLKLSKHILSRNFFNFAQNYCGATHNGWGWNFDGSSNEDELHEKIKPYMLRRLKKDMLDLPEKIRRFIPVEINMNQYARMVEKYMNKRSCITRQSEHLVYLSSMKHILAQAKTKHTIEIAETIVDAGKSVVIFTCYDLVVQDVMEAFKGNVVKITGNDSDIERQQAVEEFQRGEKQVLVANIIAGGVGITLIEAKQLIFNDFDWVPANHFQAEDRIHRIGQNEIVTINYIYAKGAKIDEYMSNLLEEKSEAINTIIDGDLGEKFSVDIKNELISLFD